MTGSARKEGLIAGEQRIGIDGGQIDLVLALGEIIDAVLLADSVDHAGSRLLDGGVTENIGTHAAIQAVAVKTARYDVVADVAQQLASTAASGELAVAVAADHDIGAAATLKDIGKIGQAECIDSIENVPWASPVQLDEAAFRSLLTPMVGSML